MGNAKMLHDIDMALKELRKQTYIYNMARGMSRQLDITHKQRAGARERMLNAARRIDHIMRKYVGEQDKPIVNVAKSSYLNCGHARYVETEHCAEITCRNYYGRNLNVVKGDAE